MHRPFAKLARVTSVSGAGARTIWLEIVCNAAVLETGEKDPHALLSLQQNRALSKKLSGKRKQGRDVNTTLSPFKLNEAVINGKKRTALVDSGCSRSLGVGKHRMS